MKTTILMFSALALVAGCSNEKTTSAPVTAAVAQHAVAEAVPPAPRSPAAEVLPRPVAETAPLPAAPARIAVPSRVPDAPGAQSWQEDGRIGAAELAALIASGDAILVDVRSAPQWRSGHAQGAIHIPYPELFERSVELPHEALIALYCT
jgi:hypothetical protein